MKKYILSLLVKNQSGVLARLSSLIGRRGYNIESISSSTTQDPHFSRITFVLTGDDFILDQVVKQTSKLQEVIKIQYLPEEEAFYRELLLVKMAVDRQTRSDLKDVADVYRARIVGLTSNTMMIELTGTPMKNDAFLEAIRDFEILEMCRTGMTAMERGDNIIYAE